jgi:hypothetical protein
VPGWTEPNEFTKYAQQTSAPIYLVAGVYYYVEMLHKEGAGGDHLALFWQTPSNNTRTVVPGSALARWVDCAPSLKARVNLQGPWDPELNQMRDDLRSSGLVPLTEPYTGLGFAHVGGGGGETVTPARLAVSGKNAVVDWVFVELRSAANPAVVVATRSALLERDGDVVDGNGQGRLFFNVPAGQYRVAIKHRNHLGAMTSTAVAFGPQVAGVDFTASALATFGTDARFFLPNGRYALWAGNVVRDGLLKYTGASNDRDAILIGIGGLIPTNTVVGYFPTDVNLDGQVKYTGASNDRDLILYNIGGVQPTAVKEEQMP